MAEKPEVIKDEIERTRGEMSDTVDALAYKTNVPARTRGWVTGKKDAFVGASSAAMTRVSDAADSLVAKASGTVPSASEIEEGTGRLKDTAERNPFGLALGAAAVGFVSGLFAPSTRIEDDKLGPTADQVKSTAVEAGQEALEHGKDIAAAASRSAVETARREGRAHGEDMTASLQEKAREISPGNEAEPSTPDPSRASGRSG